MILYIVFCDKNSKKNINRKYIYILRSKIVEKGVW